MKLKDIYKVAIEESIKQDPRGKDFVLKELKDKKEYFGSLSKEKQKEFDMESLNNPYADSRILHGDPEKEIKCALVGIDMDVGELLLIDRLNLKKNKSIDLCISHHPQGVAWAGFYEVMGMQADILANFGIPINVGENLLQERMGEVSRRVHSANHNRATDVAKLLAIPMICLHTAADNFATSFLQNLIDKKEPQNLEDIIAILKEIPEYQLALKDKAGPKIFIGNPRHKAGKIIVEMTGGTEGSKDIFDNYVTAGIGTIVAMHLSEEHYKKIKEKNINVIVAGHIASDNLGMNLLLDKIQQKGKLQVIDCSGFRRIER